MAGKVTVSFVTHFSDEDQVEDLIEQAQAQVDAADWIFPEGAIKGLRLESFEVSETVTMTRSELDAQIRTAVDAALAASRTRAHGEVSRPSGLDEA